MSKKFNRRIAFFFALTTIGLLYAFPIAVTLIVGWRETRIFYLIF